MKATATFKNRTWNSVERERSGVKYDAVIRIEN